MTETPGQAFRRIRKERRDRIKALCKTLNVAKSELWRIEQGQHRMPFRWIRLLPEDYTAALVPAIVAEINSISPLDLGESKLYTTNSGQ